MAERQKKPLSVNSFAVKLTIGNTTLDKFFTTCSRIQKTYNTSTYSDGQTNVLYELPGSVKYGDITLTKPFTEDDDTLITAINSANTKVNEYVSVDIQPVYKDGYYTQAVGGSITAKYCIVKSVMFPDINTSGDGVAELSITLSPGFVTSSGSKQFWVEPANV